ncbi:MAG: NUDIX domain-containing protein [Pseudomonadota bacterium]
MVTKQHGRPGGATEAEFLSSYDIRNYDVPLLTVDVVMLALLEDRVCVQLVNRPEHPCRGMWALPGGFVDIHQDADLDAAASRVVSTKTGIQTPYIEQLGAFGDGARDPRGWTATVVYFALLDAELLPRDAAPRVLTDLRAKSMRLQTGEIVTGDGPVSAWTEADTAAGELNLAFDHASLLTAALARLRSKGTYSALPVNLLPATFTLSRCQAVFELVVGQRLEKSAFRRRLHDADLLEQVPGAFERGSNRPAALYRIKPGHEQTVFPGMLRGERSRR